MTLLVENIRHMEELYFLIIMSNFLSYLTALVAEDQARAKQKLIRKNNFYNVNN